MWFLGFRFCIFSVSWIGRWKDRLVAKRCDQKQECGEAEVRTELCFFHSLSFLYSRLAGFRFVFRSAIGNAKLYGLANTIHASDSQINIAVSLGRTDQSARRATLQRVFCSENSPARLLFLFFWSFTPIVLSDRNRRSQCSCKWTSQRAV